MRKIWPWEDPEDIELSNGIVVKAISVPPYTLADVHEALPPPPAPMQEIKSNVTGTTETARALPGTPEFEEYWLQRRKHDRMLSQQTAIFRIDYGTVGWRYPGDDEWVDQPPEDWQPPEILGEWGVEVSAHHRNRRVAFIKYVIMRDSEDMHLLDSKWDSNRPPTVKEVKAAEAPFESAGQTELQ
jgi:hypothetical protein